MIVHNHFGSMPADPAQVSAPPYAGGMMLGAPSAAMWGPPVMQSLPSQTQLALPGPARAYSASPWIVQQQQQSAPAPASMQPSRFIPISSVRPASVDSLQQQQQQQLQPEYSQVAQAGEAAPSADGQWIYVPNPTPPVIAAVPNYQSLLMAAYGAGATQADPQAAARPAVTLFPQYLRGGLPSASGGKVTFY